MDRPHTLNTSNRPFRVRIVDYVARNAGWLVPTLWTLSGMCLVGDLAGSPVRLGHASMWLALLAIAVNMHALARHVIRRLTKIIALWQEDVTIDHR